jgi:hypothetical protein
MPYESYGERRRSEEDEAERIARHAETKEQLLEKADALWAEFRKSETIEAMGDERAATAERMMDGVKALLKGEEESQPFLDDRFRRALADAKGQDQMREEEERRKRAEDVGEEFRRRMEKG